jgi:uncharacterized protein (DUF1778 family)
MGRKKLPPGKAREKPLRIRLTEMERALVDRAARLKGSTTSAWARDGLLRLAQKIVAEG